MTESEIWKAVGSFIFNYGVLLIILIFLYRKVIAPNRMSRYQRKLAKATAENEEYEKKLLVQKAIKAGEYCSFTNDTRLMINRFDAIMNIYRSVFICGGAGSGKSFTFIKPMIKHLIVHHPCIVYDYKNPELTLDFIDQKRHHTETNKIPLYFIDFKNPERSSKINPIAPQYIPTESHAREYANVLYSNLKGKGSSGNSDPFWDDSAIAFLTGCIWYLKEEEPSKCNIPQLIELVLRPLPEVLETIRQNKSSAMICAYLISALESGELKLLTNVGATLQMAMSILVNKTVNTIFSEEQTPLTINHPDTPTQLIIGADEELSTTYAPLISLIMAVAIKQMNKADMLPSFILIDEAPTLYIPKLEELPAVARSRKISLIYCCQDISQIDATYGKEKREVLLSNLGNQFFGRTTNQTTVKYIMDLAGQQEVTTQGTSSGTSSGSSAGGESISQSSSNSTSKQMRNIYESSDITTLKAGEFIWQLSDNKVGCDLSGKDNIEITPYKP